MTKQDFFKLAEKYANGTCSEAEEKAFEAYFKELDSKASPLNTWSLTKLEQSRLRMIQDINRSTATPASQYNDEKTSSRTAWAVAASIALLLISSWYYFSSDQPEPGVALITKTTEPGQKATIKLSDGSIVRLNSGSSITYPETFSTGSIREIKLEGEAFFSVEEDKIKPFRVITGSLVTTVLGTSFNISALPSGADVKVTVASGKVNVSSNSTSGIEEYLTPGQQLTYSKETATVMIRSVDLDKHLAWKDGILLFDKTGISEALERLSRWYGVEFTGTAGSNDCLVTATYEDEALVNILESFRFIYGLEYELASNDAVVIKKIACSE